MLDMKWKTENEELKVLLTPLLRGENSPFVKGLYIRCNNIYFMS